MDEHKDTVTGFLKGLIRAFDYIQNPANEQDILQILKRNDLTVDEKNWGAMVGLQRPLMTPDGSFTLPGIDVVIAREKEANRVPANYTAAQLIRSEPLDNAQQALGVRR